MVEAVCRPAGDHTLDIPRSVSLLVAPTGLECALAFQRTDDAAISEWISKPFESHQSIEKPAKIRILKAAVHYKRDLN